MAGGVNSKWHDVSGVNGKWHDVSGGKKPSGDVSQPPAPVSPDAVPEAAGLGEAMSTYLARGGPLKGDVRRGTRYTQGPLKGMTQAQAVDRVKKMWDKAPASVREKYAAMARNQATKSEKDLANRRMAAFGRPAGGAMAADTRPRELESRTRVMGEDEEAM